MAALWPGEAPPWSRAQCEARVPPPRAFRSTFDDAEGACPLWLGFRQGPARHFLGDFADYCTSGLDPVTSNRASGSRISCQSQLPGRPNVAPALMCELRNVHLGAFRQRGNRTRPALRVACAWDRSRVELSRAAPWKHADVRFGSLNEAGQLDALALREGARGEGCLDPYRFELCNGTLTTRGREEAAHGVHVSERSARACAENAETVAHPVVLLRRFNTLNPFHSHEVFLALWSTYLARDLDPCDTELLISDDRGPGPFFGLLQRAFAPVRGARTVQGSRRRPLCIQRLIVPVDPVFHFEVPYRKKDPIKGAKCGPSPWLIGFTRYLRASFALPFHVSPVPRITFVDRQLFSGSPRTSSYRMLKNRNAFVERLHAYCLHAPSPPGQLASDGLGSDERAAAPGVGRAELPRHLRRSSGGRGSKGVGRQLGGQGLGGQGLGGHGRASTPARYRLPSGCRVTVATFHDMPIAQQLELATNTDVLVGTHSAAFTFLLYLPPSAHVVEFATVTDWHYDNLASYAGIAKTRVTSKLRHHDASYTIPLDAAMDRVMEAAAAVHAQQSKAARAATPTQEPPLPPLQPRHVPWPLPSRAPEINHPTEAHMPPLTRSPKWGLGSRGASQEASAAARLRAGSSSSSSSSRIEACLRRQQRSQHHEDYLLLPSLLSLRPPGGSGGTFVELGALDGERFSNTYLLEHCFNWSGLLIEAQPSNAAQLMRSNRPRAVKLHSAVCHRPHHPTPKHRTPPAPLPSPRCALQPPCCASNKPALL